MRVHSAMTADVVTVRPEVTLREVAKLLTERRISGAPVVDEGGRVVGVVSEADLLRSSERPRDGPHRSIHQSRRLFA